MAKRKTPPRDPKTGRFKTNPRKRAPAKRKRAPAKKTRKTSRRPNAARPTYKPNPKALPPQNKINELEWAFIDRYTAGSVLDALAIICFEKADHFEQLGNAPMVRKWRDTGRQVGTAAANAYRRKV